jgi:hypothetical protein
MLISDRLNALHARASKDLWCAHAYIILTKTHHEGVKLPSLEPKQGQDKEKATTTMRRAAFG